MDQAPSPDARLVAGVIYESIGVGWVVELTWNVDGVDEGSGVIDFSSEENAVRWAVEMAQQHGDKPPLTLHRYTHPEAVLVPDVSGEG
jgi:hypothetical protein